MPGQDPAAPEPVEVVTDHDGTTLALTADEAFAREYFTRLAGNLTISATLDEQRALRGALSGMAVAGRLRADRLVALADRSAKVPADLDEARSVIRKAILVLTAGLDDAPEETDVESIANLVAAYNGLAGDLELIASPKGPSDVELAAASLIRVAASLSTEEFPPRLEFLVRPLQDLEEAVRDRPTPIHAVPDAAEPNA